MSLLSGLNKFGLGNLEKMDVYNEGEREENGNEKTTAKSVEPQVNESSFLFDKTYECPVCFNKFHSKTVRSGRVRMIGSDTDLRQKYEGVDSLKYDAVVCPQCGYAALSRFFKYVLPAQAQMIKDSISTSFKGLSANGDTYSYDDAIERHQLALANCIVKKAKDSEKAYTCLKLAWILRGKKETLPENTPDRDKVIADLQKEEDEVLANAYEGFCSAFSKEDFPMCGMDENTVTYLMADLARRTGKYDDASRWISKVLTARDANSRLKDRARDVKDMINAEKPQ